jgi:hypothetical protein
LKRRACVDIPDGAHRNACRARMVFPGRRKSRAKEKGGGPEDPPPVPLTRPEGRSV